MSDIYDPGYDLRERIATLEAENTEMEKRCDRLYKDRYDLLGVKSTDGLSSSEWLMRTATAEGKVKVLEAENVRLKVAGDVLAATLKRDGECSCLGDQTCDGCADLANWDAAKGTK